MPGFKLKDSECRVQQGNAQAMASSLGSISLAILSSSKFSLAASQNEIQKPNRLKGVCGYGSSSCTPLGKLARTNTSLNCLHTNMRSMGNTGRIEGLEICVHPQGHHLFHIAETWWDSTHYLDTVMDSYGPFRKDRTAKGRGGAAFYFRAELECISVLEGITNELRAYE